jgi:hypothetical protein
MGRARTQVKVIPPGRNNKELYQHTKKHKQEPRRIISGKEVLTAEDMQKIVDANEKIVKELKDK